MKTLKLIFSGEKCLDNKILNIFGVQSFRYLLSKFLYVLKFFIIGKKTFIKIFNQGFDFETNFLNKDEFEKIRSEYYKAINDQKYSKIITQENRDESIEMTSVQINENLKLDYPYLYNLKHNAKIKDFFSKCEQKENINIYISLERIKTINDLNVDNQKKYHFDTFYSTFKAWLYIDDVNLDDGPFYYVKNSHRLSIKRFFVEWLFSIIYSFNKNIDGSFRYGNSLKNQKKLNEVAHKFAYKKNTFIMANTHGLHRRGDSKVNSTRDCIFFYSRENPFKIII